MDEMDFPDLKPAFPFLQRLIFILLIVSAVIATCYGPPQPHIERPDDVLPTADLQTRVWGSYKGNRLQRPLPTELQDFPLKGKYPGGISIIPGYFIILVPPQDPFVVIRIREIGFERFIGDDGLIKQYGLTYSDGDGEVVEHFYNFSTAYIYGVTIVSKGWVTVDKAGWRYRYQREF